MNTVVIFKTLENGTPTDKARCWALNSAKAVQVLKSHKKMQWHPCLALMAKFPISRGSLRVLVGAFWEPWWKDLYKCICAHCVLFPQFFEQ